MNLPKKFLTIVLLVFILAGMGVFIAGCETMFPTQETTDTDTAQQEDPGAANLFARYGTWIWLAVLVVAFYFLLIRPQRMRSKRAQDLMSNLQRGDEVVTIGGFHGRIKDIREDALIITIASGVDVKINKSAVSKKVSNQ